MRRFARRANAPALSGRLICMQEGICSYTRMTSAFFPRIALAAGSDKAVNALPSQKHSALFALHWPWPMQACESHQASNRAKRANLSACMRPLHARQDAPLWAWWRGGDDGDDGNSGDGSLARWFCSLPLACCVWPGFSFLRLHVLPQHLPQLEQWQAHNARKAASHALHQQGRSALYAVAPGLAKRLARGNVGGNARLVQRVEPHF